MLPPLASSLAYSNYSTWRQEQGGARLAEVAPGVSLEELYREGERQEVQLQRELSPPSAGRPRRRAPSSLDDFTARLARDGVYAELAAGAMARARARLLGYEGGAGAGAAELAPGADGAHGLPPAAEGSAAGDDAAAAAGDAAAEKVLAALLDGCDSREERAGVLPEACLPPGLLLAGGTRADGAGGRVCCSPQQLLAAVARRRALVMDARAGAGGQMERLASGEVVLEALSQLAEDAAEFGHVYDRLSPLERYGRGV